MVNMSKSATQSATLSDNEDGSSDGRKPGLGWPPLGTEFSTQDSESSQTHKSKPPIEDARNLQKWDLANVFAVRGLRFALRSGPPDSAASSSPDLNPKIEFLFFKYQDVGGPVV